MGISWNSISHYLLLATPPQNSLKILSFELGNVGESWIMPERHLTDQSHLWDLWVTRCLFKNEKQHLVTISTLSYLIYKYQVQPQITKRLGHYVMFELKSVIVVMIFQFQKCSQAHVVTSSVSQNGEPCDIFIPRDNVTRDGHFKHKCFSGNSKLHTPSKPVTESQ